MRPSVLINTSLTPLVLSIHPPFLGLIPHSSPAPHVRPSVHSSFLPVPFRRSHHSLHSSIPRARSSGILLSSVPRHLRPSDMANLTGPTGQTVPCIRPIRSPRSILLWHRIACTVHYARSDFIPCGIPILRPDTQGDSYVLWRRSYPICRRHQRSKASNIVDRATLAV
ncbi:hypothetical protein C8J57DRAFT_1380915 [Mycena rebaudengoi]|nr:hypothetical protein C8J57DRAFT_1398984 [Mycena rebaudengoi]KAJ7234241.1 hypothetical protein C8J57DRAFT_1380915 [Mycena rebaudengoi]